MFKLILICKKI